MMNKLYLLFALGAASVKAQTDVGTCREMAGDYSFAAACSDLETCTAEAAAIFYGDYGLCSDAGFDDSFAEDRCEYLVSLCPYDDYYADCLAFFKDCAAVDAAQESQCFDDKCAAQNYYCDQTMANDSYYYAEDEQAAAGRKMLRDDHDDLKAYYHVFLGGSMTEGDAVYCMDTVLLGFYISDPLFASSTDSSSLTMTKAPLSGDGCGDMGEWSDLATGYYTDEDSGDCGWMIKIDYSGEDVAYALFATDNAVKVAMNSFALLMLGSLAF